MVFIQAFLVDVVVVVVDVVVDIHHQGEYGHHKTIGRNNTINPCW